MGNQISRMNLKSTPPYLISMNLAGNPVEEEGITLNLPLSNNLNLIVPKIGSLNVNGGQKHAVLEDGIKEFWRVQWEDGTQISVSADLTEVEFDFCSQ